MICRGGGVTGIAMLNPIAIPGVLSLLFDEGTWKVGSNVGAELGDSSVRECRCRASILTRNDKNIHIINKGRRGIIVTTQCKCMDFIFHSFISNFCFIPWYYLGTIGPYDE